MTESELINSIDRDNHCEYDGSAGRQVCTYNPDGVPSFTDRQFVGNNLGHVHVVWESVDVILTFHVFTSFLELKDPCFEDNVEITTVKSSDYTITRDNASNLVMNYVMKVNFKHQDYFDTSRELGFFEGDEYLPCGEMTTNPYTFDPSLP